VQGDPSAAPYAVDNAKAILGKKPVFGICMGHQILGQAFGGKTFKLKFGHHGGNHPIRHNPSGRTAWYDATLIPHHEQFWKWRSGLSELQMSVCMRKQESRPSLQHCACEGPEQFMLAMLTVRPSLLHS
jgi:anthranilate/para-aminobenzoate synthase component II